MVLDVLLCSVFIHPFFSFFLLSFSCSSFLLLLLFHSDTTSEADWALQSGLGIETWFLTYFVLLFFGRCRPLVKTTASLCDVVTHFVAFVFGSVKTVDKEHCFTL